MTVTNVEIPPQTEPVLAQFAQHLAESDALTQEISTSCEITVGEHDGSAVHADGSQYVKVREYGNDGYELVPEHDSDGSITGYHPEGTSLVGKRVQELADEFFGRPNYSCGFYEDESCSRTTITP